MYLQIFLADFAIFRVFGGNSRKYLNFAGPRPRKISEALFKVTLQSQHKGQLLCSNWKITADVLKEEFLVERRIIIAILWLELLHQNHFQVQTISN